MSLLADCGEDGFEEDCSEEDGFFEDDCRDDCWANR